MYDYSVAEAVREVSENNEIFLDLDSKNILPGYLVSNHFRMFNKGLYNMQSRGIVPAISKGRHKGLFRVRSPKGYSLIVNPKSLWFKVSHESVESYLKDKKFAKDEQFKTMKIEGVLYNRYYVSNYGRIWDDRHHRFVDQYVKHDDTPYVSIPYDGKRKSFQVAQLVLDAFYMYISSLPIVHVDGHNYNNTFKNLKQPQFQSEYPSEAVDEEDTVIVVLETKDVFYSATELAKHFGISISRAYATLADNKHKTIQGNHIYRMKKSDAFPK